MRLFNRFNIFRILPTGILILLAIVSLGAFTSNRSSLINNNELEFLPVLKVSVGGTPILSNSNQDFGSVNLLSTSAIITVDLENIGLPEDLTIGSVLLSGANVSDFVLNTSGLVNTLATNATTSFTISFAPTASGTRTATIDIVSDDLSSPFKINLEGVGVKLNQTITFNPLPTNTYGDASFALGATATSGLAVSYVSDNLLVATISGNTVTIVGAGSATITASQAGDATYNAAASVPQTLLVNKASLTAAADNKTKVYGTVNPPLTVSYSGFVAGDNSSVIDVVPSISTTAVTGSTVGSYPITASGGLDNNYSFTYTAGTLSVTKATPLITWTPPASITYGAALTGSQLNASTPVAGIFTYSPALGSILNSGVNQTLSVDFIPTDATNYNSVIGTTTQLTVDKAVVTATAENKTREYNVTNPSFTIVYTGFVNGDTSGDIDVTPTATTTAILTSNVGTYPITVSGGSDNNYSFNYVSATLTITKATPVVSWSTPASIIYGTPLSATQLNASATVAGTYSYTPALGSILNVGTNQVLSVNFTPSDGTNYDVVNGTTVLISVTKAMLTVTANNQSRTYGAANPTLTISYSGFVNSENASALNTAPSAATTAIGTTAVGPYPITVSGGVASNYDFTYVSGTLTISKASVTAIAVDASRVYGAANPSFTINYTGFLNGENSSVLDTPPTASTTATILNNVGTYPITVSGGVDNNYTILYTSGILTISKATVTATAQDASRIYNTANPTFTVTYSGFVNGETSAVIDVAATATTTALLTSAVGTYPIIPSGGSDNNYTFTYVNGTLTITKATPVVSWSNPASITYGTALSAAQLNATATVAGTFVYTPAAGTILNAGAGQTLSVNFMPTDGVNYNSVPVTTTQITVTKVILTVTATNQSRTYGAANPTLTFSYSGFVNSESAAVIDVAPSISTTAIVTSPVGTYPITVSSGSDNNYDLVYSPGTLAITKAIVTATASNATRVYGAANPLFAIVYSGFLNGENFSVLDTAPITSTIAGLGSSVGTYPITVSGGVDNNYDFMYVPGNLTITKATVTVTADNKTRVYNVANPSFTIVYTGFVNGDTSGDIDVTPTATTTAILTSNVGTYPITVSGGSDNNYSFNYVSGTLTITKATPVVSWSTPASIIYGTPLSATQLNASATVAGTYSYTPALGSILNVGTNQVLSVNFTPSDGTNYNVVNGTTVLISVTKAMLTVTANNQSRTYGAANPTLTISYSGFVNSENASALNTAPSAATTAIGTTAVGPYPITVSGGVASNYDFTYVSGTLTISKASVTAIAVDASRVYGAANPSFTINYTGFLNGENSSVLDTPPTASTTATILNNVGTYPITVSGGVDNNYTILYTSGILTISKATVTATAQDASRIYNTANPTFTVTYSGFVNGETSAVIDVAATATTTALLTSAVGTYPIIPSGGSDNNYTFTYVNGTLTITKATPVVSWSNPASITYGTALSAAQLNATATVAGTFVYTPAAGTILNAGAGHVLSVNFTPTDITNYNTVNGTTVSLTVTKANPIITWTNPAPITYGTALGASELNATATVAGTFVYTPSSGTVLNAGVGQTLSVNFNPTDASNYNAINGTTVFITVNKATPTVTWINPSPIIYGTALSSTQLNATASVPGSFIYAPGLGTILNAGANQSLSVNFTPSDAVNYNSVNGTTVLITVNKATPIVSWATPADITYGTALGATQLNATASVPGTFVYTPSSGTILNAGAGQVLSVNFVPTNSANYNSVNGTTVLITVNKGTPIITWPNPASITYGTALSATQLNATSGVAGTFTYTPTLGTLLNAGTNQVLSVDFTPTDASNYNAVGGVQRLITVNKANPVITWANPAPITYGTQLSATQLNATSNVPGVFVYTPASGAILNVGTNQTLSLNFTPTDAANYNSIIGRTTLITVNKATPIVSWSTPLPLKVNEPLTGVHLNATADVAGTFTYTPPLGTTYASAGNYPLSVSFTPTDAANFNSVPTTQVQITVNTKDNPVITWANPASVMYGTTLSGVQLNATANVPGTFVYTPAAGTLLNAGTNQTLSVNFIPTDGVNYNSVSKSVQITVNKAVLTAIATSTSRIYGASNPSFVINYSGFVNSETVGVIDTAPTATCSAIAGDNAGGVFPIIPAGGVDNNYTFSYVNGSLTITKAPLTARADDKSRSYGLSNPTFSISYTGFVNGDTQSEITIPTASTVATSVSNVGTYPITLSGGSSINYNLTLQSGTLTVNISPLIAQASDKSKIYGQVNPTLTIVYVGFLNGDNVSSITQPTISTTANTTSAVGSYPINLSGGSAVNYGIILQAGTMTINKATLSISADNKTRLYGSANPSLTVSYSGFVNSENQSVIDSAPTVSTPAVTASNVGTYPISLSGGSDNNYDLVYSNGSLEITKVTLTASVTNASKIYGSTNPVFTINYSGFVNSENSSVIDLLPVASTTANASSNVGSYPITASSGLDNNYLFTYVPGTLTISKATLVATALDAGRPYGVPNPTFIINYSGFVNGETVSVIDTQPTASTTAIVASPIGNYPITISGGTDNNYSFTFVNGILSIGKSNPVITWSNPTAITYGTALSATQLNATASVAGTFTYTPAAGSILNAGANQALSVNFTPTDGVNYNPINGTIVLITVNKATPVVTWSAPAAITYGTALTGAQLNATASVPGTFTYTPPGGTILDAGANQILSVNFTPTNSNNYNSINGTTVQITVNKATPLVTWSSPAAITYGTALSSTQLNASANVPGSFTYTPASGTVLNAGINQILSVNFTPTNTTNYIAVNNTTTQITVNKATPTITWVAPTAITFGTALSATQLNATANTTGTFTYTPASGTVLNAGTNQVLSVNFTPTNLANFTVVTGVTTLINVNKANPVITWANPADVSYGVVLGSTQLNATASVPGTFTYSPVAGTLLNAGANQTLSVNFAPTNTANYNPINGTTTQLTVNKVNLTAKADNKTRVYGSTNPALTITYTGFVNGEIEAVLDTKPITSTIANTSTSVGDYSIAIAGGSDNNYNFVYTPGVLTITKATLTATADNKSRLLATPNPALTVSYSGFVNTDAVSDIDIVPIATTAAITSSPVGGYPIVVSGGSDNNYQFNYVSGILTVNPNFPPVLKNFEILAKEDQQFSFTLTNFSNNFTSFSGSPISFIKIVSLPTNGLLSWNGIPVTIGMDVLVENGGIENFNYLSNLNFAGSDSFKWNASDGSFLSNESATVSLKIQKVNDPPSLSNIEPQALLYSLGDPAITITESIVINDVDDNSIYSAKISISENFAKGDVLALGVGASPIILSSYNAITGELELTGKDSRANYEAALKKVVFSSPVSGDAAISDKKISFVVKDSVDVSNTSSRIVSITEVFPELSIVTAFTPNDDGVNDVWDFVNLEFYSSIAISVFDRNGVVVFNCESKDCAWDGTLNGRALPPGPYFYTIYLNSGKRKYQGTVTILK
jgi:gliding motility-associated-like protein